MSKIGDEMNDEVKKFLKRKGRLVFEYAIFTFVFGIVVAGFGCKMYGAALLGAGMVLGGLSIALYCRKDWR